MHVRVLVRAGEGQGLKVCGVVQVVVQRVASRHAISYTPTQDMAILDTCAMHADYVWWCGGGRQNNKGGYAWACEQGC